jgi:hypothetical protein
VIHVVHSIITITCGAKWHGGCSKYSNEDVNFMYAMCNQLCANVLFEQNLKLLFVGGGCENQTNPDLELRLILNGIS